MTSVFISSVCTLFFLRMQRTRGVVITYWSCTKLVTSHRVLQPGSNKSGTLQTSRPYFSCGLILYELLWGE